MVICKYFLQNRCAFGPRCRYEHQITYGKCTTELRTGFFSRSRDNRIKHQKFDDNSIVYGEVAIL